MHGFVTLTDERFIPGAQALVHSIRRWYPDTPVVIGCVALGREARHNMDQFADHHGNTRLLHLQVPDYKPYPWFYKARTILDSGLDEALFLDADCILTFTIPEVWEIIKAGFIWGSRSSGEAPHMFRQLTDSKMEDYLMRNPTNILTSGLCGFDTGKWKAFLEAWDDLCFTPELYKKAYGDMGFLNYLLIKNELLHQVHFSTDTKKYGALCALRKWVKYHNGMTTVQTNNSRGIVKIVHYNGIKPWFLQAKRKQKGIVLNQKAKNIWNSNATSLWLEVHNSIKKGHKAWTPIISE